MRETVFILCLFQPPSSFIAIFSLLSLVTVIISRMILSLFYFPSVFFSSSHKNLHLYSLSFSHFASLSGEEEGFWSFILCLMSFVLIPFPVKMLCLFPVSLSCFSVLSPQVLLGVQWWTSLHFLFFLVRYTLTSISTAFKWHCLHSMSSLFFDADGICK